MEKWAYFFRSTQDLTLVPEVLTHTPIERAMEVARTAQFSAEEWEAYDRAKMAEQDARGALSLATREARAEGKAEGIAVGLRPVLRQCERKLGRTLSGDERTTLHQRLDQLGAERLGDVVLDLDGAALGAWLTDPKAT